MAAFRFNDDRFHIGHYLIMGNAGARIVQTGLHLRLDPCRITGRLLFRFKFRNQWGKDYVRGGTSGLTNLEESLLLTSGLGHLQYTCQPTDRQPICPPHLHWLTSKPSPHVAVDSPSTRRGVRGKSSRKQITLYLIAVYAMN